MGGHAWHERGREFLHFGAIAEQVDGARAVEMSAFDQEGRSVLLLEELPGGPHLREVRDRPVREGRGLSHVWRHQSREGEES